MYDPAAQHRTTVLRYAQELLGTRFPKYQTTLLRAASTLVTQEEMNTFCKLMMELYEAGFLKATNDYRKQAEAMGLKVTVKAEKK